MKYFAIIEGEQRGPYELDQLADAGVTPNTYVWCKEMDDWARAGEVADICRFFRRRIFDLNHPSLTPVAESGAQANPDASYDEGLDSVPPRFRYPISKVESDDVDFGSFKAQEDYSQPPVTWYPFPILISVLFFFPLGILAINQALKSRKAWKEGKAEAAHEYARRGKMAAGMGISFGLILVAGLIHILF